MVPKLDVNNFLPYKSIDPRSLNQHYPQQSTCHHLKSYRYSLNLFEDLDDRSGSTKRCQKDRARMATSSDIGHSQNAKFVFSTNLALRQTVTEHIRSTKSIPGRSFRPVSLYQRMEIVVLSFVLEIDVKPLVSIAYVQ
jgi:hypothetical protein